MEKFVAFFAVLFVMIVAVLIIVALWIGIGASFHNEYGKRFTVTGKEAVKSEKSGKYLVFTDVTTYEVEDSILNGRWDSSDVYGKLTIGKTYEAQLQGRRIPFLSMYQNIINPVEVPAGVEAVK